MKVKGFLNINDNHVSFILDEDKIIVVEEFDIDSIFSVFDKREFDLIRGITDNNNDIVFFGCIYYKHYLSAKGWVVSTNNLNSDPLERFDSICFRGKALDTFYSPKLSYYIDTSYNDPKKQMAPLIFKPWKEVKKSFDIQIDEESLTCMFDMYINYNMKRNNHNLGDVYSQMSLLFNESKKIEQIPKYYLYVFDFMKFISYRRNIKFDHIELRRKVEDGLYEKIAIVEFRTGNDSESYLLEETNCIILNEIEKDFHILFPYVVNRRYIGYMDDLFIPLNDLDYRSIDPNKFLSCALSFEGEYSKAFPKEKESTNIIFSDIKNKAIELITQMEYDEGSKGANKRAKSYVNRIIKDISNIDGTLEEKFNNACNKFNNIIGEYIKKVILDGNIEQNTNLGEAFSEMRNSIGHGNPKKIEKEHIVSFRIARCLIYVIILNSANVEHKSIKNIVEKLF